MADVEFVENLAPPVSGKGGRKSRYDIGAIKVDGALLVPVAERQERFLTQPLRAAVKRYRTANPATNFVVAPYTDALGTAYIGVFRLADTPPPSLHVAAE